MKVCLHFVDLALIRLQFEDFFSSNFRRKKSWNLIYILFRHNRLQTIWRIFSTKILILQTCWAIQCMMTHFCLDLKCTRKDARTIHERQKCFILLWLPIRIFVGMSQWFEKISDFVFGVTVKGPSTNLTLQTKNFSSLKRLPRYFEKIFFRTHTST